MQGAKAKQDVMGRIDAKSMLDKMESLDQTLKANMKNKYNEMNKSQCMCTQSFCELKN
jgi:hypothetical protein